MEELEHNSTDKNREHSSFFARLLHASKPGNVRELTEIIRDAGKRGIIDTETTDMLRGVFDVGRLRVSDIMIPRSDIITININASLEQAVQIIGEAAHSRYPVITEDKDHVAGILLAKDLLPYCIGLKKSAGSLKELLREPEIVPESRRVNAMLKDFQSRRFHMAVVVDEFGGVSGLITIEDILELIVGDIADEYDSDEDEVAYITKAKNEEGYLVNGLTPLEDFAEFFEITLPEVEVDTVAGLVLHALGRFPQKDEVVNVAGCRFKIVNATPRRVHQLLVTKLPEDEGQGNDR
ncbi:MAG: CBS domain-containing protein [Succinivibrio sp.]|nr:CBS domain-containing protein [Succinivibrio sp.]